MTDGREAGNAMDDPGDGVARWRRVADGIRVAIGDGDMAHRLPSEGELADRFGVNRHTVRRAIAALAADGVVRAERGRGTFVTGAGPRVPYMVGPRTRFRENLLAQARHPAGELLRADAAVADASIAALLGCAVGAPLHRIESLSSADGVPLAVATSWFPAERFPGLAEAFAEYGSVTESLRREGVVDYHRRETRVSTERITADDARQLAASADALVLVARAVDVDLDGRPVQALRTRFHAERIELVFRH